MESHATFRYEILEGVAVTDRIISVYRPIGGDRKSNLAQDRYIMLMTQGEWVMATSIVLQFEKRQRFRIRFLRLTS